VGKRDINRKIAKERLTALFAALGSQSKSKYRNAMQQAVRKAAKESATQKETEERKVGWENYNDRKSELNAEKKSDLQKKWRSRALWMPAKSGFGTVRGDTGDSAS
jgi:hypothetical protein